MNTITDTAVDKMANETTALLKQASPMARAMMLGFLAEHGGAKAPAAQLAIAFALLSATIYSMAYANDQLGTKYTKEKFLGMASDAWDDMW